MRRGQFAPSASICMDDELFMFDSGSVHTTRCGSKSTRVDIQYENISLYIPMVQLIGALSLASVTNMCVQILLPYRGKDIRSISFSMLLCVVAMYRPMVCGPAKGIGMMFAALRPACAVWLCAVAVSHLQSECGQCTPYAASVPLLSKQHVDVSWFVFYACTAVAACAGMAASVKGLVPPSYSCLMCFIVCASLLVSSVYPPSSTYGCSAPDIFNAAEFVVRTLLYGACYSCLIYTTPPRSMALHDLQQSVTYATCLTVWIHMAPVYMLVFAPMQCAILIFSSLRHTREYDSVSIKSNESDLSDLNEYGLDTVSVMQDLDAELDLPIATKELVPRTEEGKQTTLEHPRSLDTRKFQADIAAAMESIQSDELSKTGG